MSGQICRNIVIFGGTGDLTYRKLIPALYNLFKLSKIGAKDRILIIGRRDYTKEDYVAIIKGWVEKHGRFKYDKYLFEDFVKQLVYLKMDFTNSERYQKLSEMLNPISENIFYYAVAPRFFTVITEGIISLHCGGKSKVIIEKPFGETLADANDLSIKLEERFGKENVYRIDHYLGKEMVQSIQTIRFSNPIFKNSWDKDSIESVQIIASEEVGVETRASYYDGTGAVKDMLQNHLMQILSLIAMEESEKNIKTSQTEVLKNLRKIEQIVIKDTLVLGQYENYTREAGVNPNSKTETFAQCKLFIDTPRWQDVPFYIVTGKKLTAREFNIIITFKLIDENVAKNTLVFKIQPTEGMSFEFNIKKPGANDEIIQTKMDFCQSCNILHNANTPEAYERLLYAVMMSDRTWFSTWEQIYLSWNYMETLKKLYTSENLPLHVYHIGSHGPLML